MKQKSGQRRSAKPQATDRKNIRRLEHVPNVGPAVAGDLRRLGIMSPADLLSRDPYAMYDDLCRITGQRHDPCLLDTFIAAVRFMAGEPKKPWWKYTPERKRELAARSGERR
jgi:Pathogenicity locus